MFKLKFRSTPMIALGVLIAIGASAGGYFILKGMSDKLLELHMAAVFAAILLLPLLITVVAYQMTTAAQKLQVSSLMIGLILILTGVDNFLIPQMRMLPDGVLLFNWLAFVITLAGGIASTFLMLTGSQDSVYGDVAPGEKEDPKERKRREQEVKDAEKAMSQSGSGALRGTVARAPAFNPEGAKTGEDAAPAKTSIEQLAPNHKEEERKAGSTSATNLKGLLDTLAPEDDDEIVKPSKSELDAIRPSSSELDAIKPSASALDSIKTPVSDPKPEVKSPLRSMLKKPDSPASQLTKPGSTPAPAPAPAPEPAPAAEVTAKAEEKPATPVAPAAENKEASPTSTMRLQAQKRKGTSTFTKLQALSASGGVRTDKPQGTEGGELKSILDKLDSTADTTEEAPMDSLFGGGRLVTSRTDIPAISEESPEASQSLTPAAPPSQLKRPGLGVTLGGTKSRPEPVATPAAEVPSAASAPAVTPAAEPAASNENLSDMLNSIQTPGSGGNKSASGGLGLSGLAAKAGASNKIGIGSHGTSSSADLTPVPEPISATSEVAKAPELPVVEEPIVQEVVIEEPIPEPTTTAAPADDEDEDSQSIFAKGVDKEIDEIFDNLVSEDAQKEVKDVDITSLGTTEVAEPAIVVEEAEKIEIVEPEAKIEEPQATPTPASDDEDEEQSGLFGKSLDSELDDIFSNLAPEEAQKKVTHETLAQVRSGDAAAGEEELSFEPPAQSAASSAETDESKAGKFVDTLGNLPAMDAAKTPVQISAKDATVKEQQSKSTETSEHPVVEEAASVAKKEEETSTAAPAKEIKEFGRLSARVSATAKPSETPGTMKTIGKLLIDVQAVENVIKHGETGQIGKNLASARVLSAQRGEGIQNILNKIDAYPGIAGSLIVGHDGLVIASTLKSDMDRDTVGVLSVACLSTSNLGTRKLEIGKLKQMVMITNTTVNVFTDVDVGILAVFMTDVQVDKIDGLLETIQNTIHG